MSEQNPLTLEQLRNAYDFSKRVGLHVLIQFDSSKCEYEGVIDYRDDDGICAVYAASGEWLKEKEYGKTWVAYKAEPNRIARSEWEPCEYCRDYSGKCCANCWHGGNQAYQEPCKHCYCGSKWKPKENFCPYCGRPMHDSAWEMLEKRLEGRK